MKTLLETGTRSKEQSVGLSTSQTRGVLFPAEPQGV
jgi:hypothetical protein